MPSSSGSVSPGAVVGGRYRLERVLGEGGAGTVFAARDLSMDRSVAIKVLRPDMLHVGGGLERFRREAELARRLSHPNTIRVLDFAEDPSGIAFIVFELLRGTSLEDALEREGPQPVSRVIEITRAVLKSLMEAHATGVVHRDIKPSNLFLCDATQGGIVKVLDFGVARVDRATRAVTEAGDVLGTPRYMAPEQVRGEPVGPETDLYALGLVAAEALSGRPVYDDPSAVRVCMQQIDPSPVPLPPAALSSALGPLLVIATQKDRSRRFPSAVAMLDALAGVETSSPTQRGPAPEALLPLAPPPSPAAPLPVRSSRRWLVGALAIGAAALLGAGVLALRQASSRGTPATSLAPVGRAAIGPARLSDFKKRVADAGWRASDLEVEELEEGGAVLRAEVTRFTRFGDVELYELDSEARARALAEKVDAEVEGDLVRRRGRRVARASIDNGPEAMEKLVEALLE